MPSSRVTGTAPLRIVRARATVTADLVLASHVRVAQIPLMRDALAAPHRAGLTPEGAASRGRPLPFERMPGVSAGTRRLQCTG
jgi:hypothetical protein